MEDRAFDAMERLKTCGCDLRLPTPEEHAARLALGQLRWLQPNLSLNRILVTVHTPRLPRCARSIECQVDTSVFLSSSSTSTNFRSLCSQISTILCQVAKGEVKAAAQRGERPAISSQDTLAAIPRSRRRQLGLGLFSTTCRLTNLPCPWFASPDGGDRDRQQWPPLAVLASCDSGAPSDAAPLNQALHALALASKPDASPGSRLEDLETVTAVLQATMLVALRGRKDAGAGFSRSDDKGLHDSAYVALAKELAGKYALCLTFARTGLLKSTSPDPFAQYSHLPQHWPSPRRSTPPRPLWTC